MLSRLFLLKNKKCCGEGCLMCPYEPKHFQNSVIIRKEVIKVCTSKMRKAFEVFSHDLASLRTGRANVSMLDIIKVDV